MRSVYLAIGKSYNDIVRILLIYVSCYYQNTYYHALGAGRVMMIARRKGGQKMVQNLIFLQFLFAAGICDLRFRKVPNAVILAALFWGFLSLLLGICFSGTACMAATMYVARFFLTVFVLALPFRYFGAGAGDVKLIALFCAQLGFWKGMEAMLPGCLIALLWHAAQMQYTPLAFALFLGAVPLLCGL